jgi:hypothetical protein
MIRRLRVLLLVLGLILVTGGAAGRAQTEGLELRLRRDFGYGSGTQMQGYFSMRVDGGEEVQSVRFFVDDQLIGEDHEAPFAIRFNTGSYDLGWHTLTAVGVTASGTELTSNSLRRQFVSGQTAIYVVFAVVALVVVFRVASHYLTRQRSGAQPQQGYGVFGGAICPNCGKTFSRHWWGINLMVGRLDRCPRCGKWSLTNRASPAALEAAEAAFAEPETPEKDDRQASGVEDDLRRQLDASRYEDLD